MKNLGLTETARRMAQQGRGEAAIRAALAGNKPASIYTAIFQARQQGYLPPRQKQNRNSIRFALPDDCVDALSTIAARQGCCVAAAAKKVMIERLRGRL